MFVQQTVVPGGTVVSAGSKPKSTIEICVEPAGIPAAVAEEVVAGGVAAEEAGRC